MHAKIPFSTARLDRLRRGFIKLEDTIAVTPDGYHAFDDGARGWNRIPA